MTTGLVVSVTDELVAELEMLATRNHAYVPVKPDVMRALLVERAKRVPLYEAVERACGELPDGWQISICMENGAGWVELYDDCGVLCDNFPTNNERLDYTVNDAIDAAMQSEAKP
jgi:hypothetical protein